MEDGTGSRRPLLGDAGIVTPPDSQRKGRCRNAAVFFAWKNRGRRRGCGKLSGVRKPLPLGATATTAASGGNREELLGQRPAGCKRQRSRRWEPQPGLWHAAGVTERFGSRWRVELNQKNGKYQKFPVNPSKHFLNEESWIFPLRQRKSVTIAADAALGSAAHGEEGERKNRSGRSAVRTFEDVFVPRRRHVLEKKERRTSL